MKAVVSLAFLCAFVAISTAENCGSVGDCNHVTCPENDYQLDCHNRQCTCTHTTVTCASKNDCTSTGDHCGGIGWHCIDAKCRCFSFGGNGK